MTWEQITGCIGALITLAILATIYFRVQPRKRGHGISLLVPFRTDNDRRAETWNWLEQYWRRELPGAEIIIGQDDSVPFCKTAAVNNAARHAGGDVFVILDADCYVAANVIEFCANEIRKEVKRGNRLWFIPYRSFYRLNDLASRHIISSSTGNPFQFFASGPKDHMLDSKKGIDRAHWFGALIQILPKEAFDITGGMDTRFNGWGGEDVAYMHAVDTLYVSHKTTSNGVIHLWHPSIGTSVKDRKWSGQNMPGTNGTLSMKYHRARGDYNKMRKLIDDGESVATEIFGSQPDAYE